MEVREIQNKEIWEDFLLECKEKTFLSSWNWGEFQKSQGNEIWRIGIYDDNELRATALVTKIKARRGTFLLIQHGPSFFKATEDKAKLILKTLINELKKIGAQENCSFVRMASFLERNEENNKIFKNLGFREAPMHANAYEATWKLDIAQSEEDILKNMRKTTRYLLRQAMKNPDISIEKSQNLRDAEAYQRLNKEVAARQNFVPFSENYIKNEFEIFSKENEASWLFGKYKGELAAAALVIFWSGIGFYHHAALFPQYHKIPIAYLLQWEAIKEAKKRGCNLYDFWGYVDPQKQPRHPWAGPTLFKMGFGGMAFEYVKTQDFPLSKKYWFTYIFEKLRKTKRGL